MKASKEEITYCNKTIDNAIRQIHKEMEAPLESIKLVWFNYTLANMKMLFVFDSKIDNDADYVEVTVNSRYKEMYYDYYAKTKKTITKLT